MSIMYLLPLLHILLCDSFVTAKHYGFVFPNATDPKQEDLVLDLGQEIEIRWYSPFIPVKLAWVSEDGSAFGVISQNNTRTDLDWAVDVINKGCSNPFYYLYFESEIDKTRYYHSARFRVYTSDDMDDHTQRGPASATVMRDLVLQARATRTALFDPFNTAVSTTTDSITFVGLRESAKIGIGVGIPLGVLAFAGLLFFVFWRKQRRARAEGGEEQPVGVLNLAGGDYSPENIPVPFFLGGGDDAEPTANETADEKSAAQAEQQGGRRKDKAKISKHGAGRNRNTGYASIEQRLEMSGIKKVPQKPNKGKGRAADVGTIHPGDQGAR